MLAWILFFAVQSDASRFEDYLAPIWEFQFPYWNEKIEYKSNKHLIFTKTNKMTNEKVNLNISFFDIPNVYHCVVNNCQGYSPTSCDIGINSIYCVWYAPPPNYQQPWASVRQLYRYDILSNSWSWMKDHVAAVRVWDNTLFIVNQANYNPQNCNQYPALIERCNLNLAESNQVECNVINNAPKLGCVNGIVHQNKLQHTCKHEEVWKFESAGLFITINLERMIAKTQSREESDKSRYFESCAYLPMWKNTVLVQTIKLEKDTIVSLQKDIADLKYLLRVQSESILTQSSILYWTRCIGLLICSSCALLVLYWINCHKMTTDSPPPSYPCY
jgi:hypothetical protein